jgi:carboxymethylenebutenolidase
MPAELLGPSAAKAPRVLVVHSWWGLTQSFRDFGAALAEAGLRVALADLYDGSVARTAEEARALRAKPRRRSMYRTLEAAIDGLGGGRIGVVGFSMGGHWAVWLSQRPEYEVAAAVLYYAARGGDFSESRAAYLAHFAARDPWVSASARRGMERALARAKSRYEAWDYPGTGHWFAETGVPDAYAPDAAGLALERTVAHLRRQLGG